MKKIISALLFITLLSFGLQMQAAVHYNPYVIDAERNARIRNNIGLLHFKDGYYNAAIKEFNIAISLNPDTQATATYYSNLANVYMKIGYPALAQDSLERALKCDKMNLTYYQDLVQTFRAQNILSQKLTQYSQDTQNPISPVIVGLIMIEMGQETQGLTKLQAFCYNEPDLIITGGVRSYIQQKTRRKR